VNGEGKKMSYGVVPQTEKRGGGVEIGRDREKKVHLVSI